MTEYLDSDKSIWSNLTILPIRVLGLSGDRPKFASASIRTIDWVAAFSGHCPIDCAYFWTLNDVETVMKRFLSKAQKKR